MRRLTRSIPVLVVMALVASTTPASAQSTAPASTQGTAGIGWEGWGIRAGVSAEPDQVYGGVHFDLGHFAKDVRFRPTAEFGFLDDRMLFQALAEVHYVFSKVQVWKPYVGGGLGLNYADVDDDGCSDCDDSDTEFSFAGIGGVETKLKSGTGFHLELKIGLGNDPDAKFGVGWSF